MTAATGEVELKDQRSAIGAVTGLIAGALGHNSMHALVSAPAWLMVLVCWLLAFALARSVR